MVDVLEIDPLQAQREIWLKARRIRRGFEAEATAAAERFAGEIKSATAREAEEFNKLCHLVNDGREKLRLVLVDPDDPQPAGEELPDAMIVGGQVRPGVFVVGPVDVDAGDGSSIVCSHQTVACWPRNVADNGDLHCARCEAVVGNVKRDGAHSIEIQNASTADPPSATMAATPDAQTAIGRYCTHDSVFCWPRTVAGESICCGGYGAIVGLIGDGAEGGEMGRPETVESALQQNRRVGLIGNIGDVLGYGDDEKGPA